MLNYTKFKGTITFFHDPATTPPPPPGGAVWVRPNHPAWADVPQLRGQYDTTPLTELDYHDDN
jgi:hypothetical protein